jgi:hypothetical protein
VYGQESGRQRQLAGIESGARGQAGLAAAIAALQEQPRTTVVAAVWVLAHLAQTKLLG